MGILLRNDMNIGWFQPGGYGRQMYVSGLSGGLNEDLRKPVEDAALPLWSRRDDLHRRRAGAVPMEELIGLAGKAFREDDDYVAVLP